MADNGVTCSMSRSGNVWDNATMESFFSSMKTERIGRKTYRTRNHAKADMFDYIERFYNPTRRHATLGYLSPMDFERQAQVSCGKLCRPRVDRGRRHQLFAPAIASVIQNDTNLVTPQLQRNGVKTAGNTSDTGSALYSSIPNTAAHRCWRRRWARLP